MKLTIALLIIAALLMLYELDTIKTQGVKTLHLINQWSCEGYSRYYLEEFRKDCVAVNTLHTGGGDE